METQQPQLVSSTLVVVNPTSGGGKGAKMACDIVEAAKESLADPLEIVFTKGPGGGTLIAADGVRRGHTTIVVIGGDGTLSEVVHGAFNETARRREEGDAGVAPPRLLYLPTGTGADFARLGVCCKSAKEAVAVLAQERPREQRVDVGCMTYLATTLDGAVDRNAEPRGRRFYINVCSVGLSIAVINRAEQLKGNRCLRPLGGKAVFFASSFVELLLMKRNKFYLRRADPLAGPQLGWISDRNGNDGASVFDAQEGEAAPQIEVDATNIAFCNGRYFGGGMQVAPGASYDDSRLDVTVWGEKFLGFLSGLVSVYNGRHLKWKSTKSLRGRAWEISTTPFVDESAAVSVDQEEAPLAPGADSGMKNDRMPVEMEVDGERGMVLPALVEALPEAAVFLVP